MAHSRPLFQASYEVILLHASIHDMVKSVGLTRGSNLSPPECETSTLPLDQSADYHHLFISKLYEDYL